MKKIITLLFASVLFFSCSDDKVKSSQNYIVEFSLPPEINPVQINIINEQNEVHILTNAANIEKLKKDPETNKPTVVPSKDAKTEEVGNDWTAPDFVYVITAENGDSRRYSVIISTSVPNKNSFENWTSDKGYYVLSDLNWTSGNSGISTALQFLGKDNKNPENYPTKRTPNGKEGYAVVMETIEGGTILVNNMPIISGNFFVGNFNVGKAMSNDPLTATEFGKLYFAKPKSITGYYKYKEGDGAFIGSSSKNDSCDIYAGFYQASDDSGNEIILTAKDKDDLDKFLAYARLDDCSTTQGEDFQTFELKFDAYKSEPDFEKYNYKLFITFAASRGGAAYEGKIGSQLIVDEVVIEDN